MHMSSPISQEDKLTTILQVQGLSYLKKHSKATVGELASELMMSSPAITKFTDRLVNLGWIRRADDSDDRRIIRLFITSLGEKKLSQIQRKHLERMSEIFSLMPEKDIKELIRIMGNLTKKWEEKNKT